MARAVAARHRLARFIRNPLNRTALDKLTTTTEEADDGR